jgi:dihydroflavonol-4-reductase
LVFTSSAAAVGLRADGKPADETIPFNLPPRRFPYGYSKAQAEDAVRQAVEQGQDAVILNPVVILGPGDLNLISGSMIREIARLQWATTYTSGGVAVIDVRDVARAHLAAAEKGWAGERYILGAANYSYRQLFALIADVIGVAPPAIYVPDVLLPPLAALVDLARTLGLRTPVDANQVRLGAHNIHFDFSKAWDELGKPQIPIRQSIEDTYAWYRERGYMQPDRLARLLTWLGKRLGK